jgi:hypothetical protein
VEENEITELNWLMTRTSIALLCELLGSITVGNLLNSY